MEPSEENMKTLMNMGFVDVTAIKRALRLAKNDVNEAVAILTNENPGGSYDTLDDVEMKDMGKGGKSGETGSAPDPPPPSYDEAVEPVEDEDPSSTSTETKDEENHEASREFPTTNLYELESRVFTDQWSIPYKKEESLGKCLIASTRLAEEGLMDADENCMRFVTRCMPEAFKKLMTSNAVHRWGGDIQEGIYNMLQLLIDLAAARLKHKPIPCDLLGVLNMAFNPDTEFHYKNRSKQWERLHWEEVFGVNQTFAVSPPFNQYKEPCGWLVNLINRFAQQGGFEEIKKHVLESSDDLDPSTMACLLQPLGTCAEYLNVMRFSAFLSLAEKKTLTYVTEIADNELKQKKAGSISDLLCTMKILCLLFWVDDVQEVDDLRLHIALRMLKSPHFNAKMNSLKEITKLIEDSTSTRTNRNAIPEDKILEWLVENKVLSIALEGSIDQSQYCDKLKGIVEFLGIKLSLDELTKIWKMQNDQPLTVVDNIHSIMASAAVKFNNEQLEHLFMLIQKAWKGENDRIQEKLLSLIGRIGRDARNNKTTCKVLELLWDLAHLPGIPTPHLEHALEEHLAILSESFAVSQQVKSKYVLKCVEDIKKGQTVVPALRQLHHIVKGITKQSYSKHDKGLPQELNRNHEIIKLVTQSLLKCHKMAVNAAEDGHLSAKTIVDGRWGYTHSEHVEVHLRFLAFILQEGALYLQWHRAREIWDCLVANPEAHESDKETCFEWFRKGLSDLETDTQMQLFREKLLKLEPATLSPTGFECVKAFFESVNINNHSLKKGPAGLIVDKLDLFGLEFMWQIALETPNEDIANAAVKQLMRVSYGNLSQRLKKDPVALHKRFIDQCYKRLELATITMGGSTIAYGVSHATRLLTATTVPEVASVPSPSRAAKLLVIERLLQLAETYVTTVEDLYSNPRTILPHGASFQGPPITMHVTCDSPKHEFVLVGHANETLQGLRQKIAQRMKTSADNVQIAAHDRMLLTAKDQKLLRQLDFEEEQVLTVKTLGVTGTVSRIDESASSLGSKPYTSEQERLLPGVVMATGGQVFEKLYQLADLEESKITERVRNLLMLIPTDPSVQEALDSICKKESADDDNCSGDNSPQESSKAILEGLFRSNVQSMSPFRVLYNLEVLSSRLMPSMQEDSATVTSAQNFRESFLNAGGLSLVVNVLQRESMPIDVDEEIMRGCYAISLHLARFLLCGQTTTSVIESDLEMTGSLGDTSADTSSLNLSSSFGTSPRKMSLVERMSSLDASGDVAYREGTSVAITVIQTMNTTSFTSMIACLMRMAWASAAGRLRLASSSQPIRDSPGNIGLIGLGRRSRHSSAGSSASTSSENEIQALQAWVCLLASKVSNKDAMIAREALELLVACLQLRHQNMASFYNLTGVSDFIIDILLGCPHHEIRNAALEQLYTLSITEGMNDNLRALHPRQFLLQVLLKAPVPLWTSSCFVRGASQKVLAHCTQYFELRCRLLDSLTLKDQKLLQIRPASMLEDEIDWLNNFEPSDVEESSLWVTDNLVMAGHLNLAKMLLTCEGMDKTKIGEKFIDKLLNEFLFPASKLILESSMNNRKVDSQADYNPKIAGNESRCAAFDLLVVLAENCPENLQQITTQLIRMHHQPDPATAKEWENDHPILFSGKSIHYDVDSFYQDYLQMYVIVDQFPGKEDRMIILTKSSEVFRRNIIYLPPVDGRSPSKYVGLRNGGATCYMNSVIQQLYHVPGIREGLLKAILPDTENDGVFYQMQTVFGHLMESKLQYYEPELFWKVFKLWGQPVNIREQQDAFEFFTNLTDQLDEHLKKNNQKEVFKPKFRGVFSDQKICQDCPHRYEREEEFFALNLTVKSHNLESSLEQFVRGEMLEGDNAYMCEKCEEKRNAIKRMCIKTLPSVLVIQLKRFGYDWEAGRALKFDDYFKFPWVLDMEPYTVKGMASREEAQQSEEPSDLSSNGNSNKKNTSVQSCSDELYQLVGIVVHSGQANAGHYYSFIRDRWGTSMNNPTKGRWFRFNDTVVEEFEMTDAALEAECFGGSYKPKIYEPGSSYTSETRLRYWSGYMLFYEKLEGSRTPDPYFHGPLSRGVNMPLLKQDSEGEIHVVDPGQCSSPELSPHHEKDRLSELSALVRKGEHRGLFVDKMPPAIQRAIHDENLQFLRYRGIYTNEYFTFIRSLASCNVGYTYQQEYGTLATTSMQLALQFLLNTFFRTKKKLRNEVEDWCMCVERLLKYSSETSRWALEFVASHQGKSYTTPFLLECPTQEIRGAYARILVSILQSYYHHTSKTDSPHLDNVIEYLLSLMDKEVADHCRTCGQYFWLLSVYLETDVTCVQHLYRHSAFQRLMTFLIGPIQGDEQDFVSRRWTSLQTREFAYLHIILASMILYCDVSPHWTVGRGDAPDRKKTFILPNNDKLCEMPPDMKKILAGPECIKYIRETILAFRELIGGTVPIVDMLLHCSFCNQNFSVSVLSQIQEQVSTAPVNELKPVFAMLLELLLMEDPLQKARLKCAVEGNSNDGLLETIRSGTQSDSRRSYQCIKFLVHLSNKCPLAKDYLMSISSRWQWAVNWLKKKMTEYYWTPQSSISNESSTSKSFQRTMSAQDTLAEATALLTELNTRDDDDDEDDEVMEGETTPKMEVNGSSEGSEGGNDNEKPQQPVENDEGDLEDIDT